MTNTDNIISGTCLGCAEKLDNSMAQKKGGVTGPEDDTKENS